MNCKGFFDRYSYKLFVIVMIALIVFLRLYKLSDVPVGLHIDEAGIAYDAWCLLSEGQNDG